MLHHFDLPRLEKEKKEKKRPNMVAHTCNLSTLGGWRRRIIWVQHLEISFFILFSLCILVWICTEGSSSSLIISSAIFSLLMSPSNIFLIVISFLFQAFSSDPFSVSISLLILPIYAWMLSNSTCNILAIINIPTYVCLIISVLLLSHIQMLALSLQTVISWLF